jgi:hypothetical protein
MMAAFGAGQTFQKCTDQSCAAYTRCMARRGRCANVQHRHNTEREAKARVRVASANHRVDRNPNSTFTPTACQEKTNSLGACSNFRPTLCLATLSARTPNSEYRRCWAERSTNGRASSQSRAPNQMPHASVSGQRRAGPCRCLRCQESQPF